MTNDASHSDRAGTPDWDAIARFLAGDSPAEEAARVDRWLQSHPGDRALVENLNAAITPVVPADVDVEAALKRVHQQMEQPDVRHLAVERGGAPKREAPSRRGPIFVAALVAAAAAAFAVITLRGRSDRKTDSQPITRRTYFTQTGRRDSITLADGSRVILGPDSRLVVPGDYGKSTRTVELQGDGYFDVRHDPVKAFVVQVGHAVVEDVGTTFMIESDAGDAATVSVMSGSVRLRSTDTPASPGAVLAAGDRGAVGADGQVKTYSHVVVPDDTSWTAGHVVFRDVPVRRIAAELRRWYGLEVQASDSAVFNRTANTFFDNGEPIDAVLNRLALLLGVRIDRQNNVATIH